MDDDADFTADREIAKRLHGRFIDAVTEEGANDFVTTCVCLGLVAGVLGEMPKDERAAKLPIVKSMFRDILKTLGKFSVRAVQ